MITVNRRTVVVFKPFVSRSSFTRAVDKLGCQRSFVLFPYSFCTTFFKFWETFSRYAIRSESVFLLERFCRKQRTLPLLADDRAEKPKFTLEKVRVSVCACV